MYKERERESQIITFERAAIKNTNNNNNQKNKKQNACVIYKVYDTVCIYAHNKSLYIQGEREREKTTKKID